MGGGAVRGSNRQTQCDNRRPVWILEKRGIPVTKTVNQKKKKIKASGGRKPGGKTKILN